MYLAPPIVQSEVLNYNDSLSSTFSALHIHERVHIFSEHASKLCVKVAASLVVKTGIPKSDCDISAYKKMRIPKVKLYTN